MCNLSALLTEDVIEYVLAFADVPTLRALKGVSVAWRARARRVLEAVTTLDLSGSRAAGRLFADLADAACGLPNLARVTGLGGFEVDVAALRSVASSGEDSYRMAGIRGCIRGVGEAPMEVPPMEVLLAACALRHGEARVPANAFRGDTSMSTIALYPRASPASGRKPSIAAPR